ncbi:MAG TPA: SDR family oxidoreductase [Phycisphaerae bacterium]|nr:SDR family oxidoreductase [Phycisphaerae bacterium]
MFPTAKHSNIVDRVAIVTGGSSGIGRSICELLGKAVARVVVVGRNELRM